MAATDVVTAASQRRVQVVKGGEPAPGSYVLYWMQSAVRAEHNHALEHAIGAANDLECPLLVCACINPAYPEAAPGHMAFFKEGLKDAVQSLGMREIPAVICEGEPVASLRAVLDEARLVVTDDKPLRHHTSWVSQMCDAAQCPVHVVETNVVVPVSAALGKEAYSAASLRPRIMPLVPAYLEEIPEVPVIHGAPELASSFSTSAALAEDEAEAVLPKGGHQSALETLRAFMGRGLASYDACRSAPGANCTSKLSPYLHFGHISPCEVLRFVMARSGPGVDAFVEQLVVRRELAVNFVHYNEHYDTPACLPEWALTTLGRHARDARDYEYSLSELDSCSTHDPYWNAAQRQMERTGHMDGYMRMYWGKKVIEWSPSPEVAYSTLLRLNNRYELDGRDPNGYAGVAWCFGKHDRPWKERAIFGTVRYMNDKGLVRKFDMNPYLAEYGE